jgi:predicted nuclease of predicted toxin-antitoxin system
MNIPLEYSRLLKEKGVEIILWYEVGSPMAPDEDLIRYASNNDCVILTYDLDFSAVLSITRALKPSIIQLRISYTNADRAIDMIVAAMQRYSNELAQGAILSINPKKARVRLLPI